MNNLDIQLQRMGYSTLTLSGKESIHQDTSSIATEFSKAVHHIANYFLTAGYKITLNIFSDFMQTVVLFKVNDLTVVTISKDRASDSNFIGSYFNQDCQLVHFTGYDSIKKAEPLLNSALLGSDYILEIYLDEFLLGNLKNINLLNLLRLATTKDTEYASKDYNITSILLEAIKKVVIKAPNLENNSYVHAFYAAVTIDSPLTRNTLTKLMKENPQESFWAILAYVRDNTVLRAIAY